MPAVTLLVLLGCVTSAAAQPAASQRTVVKGRVFSEKTGVLADGTTGRQHMRHR